MITHLLKLKMTMVPSELTHDTVHVEAMVPSELTHDTVHVEAMG